MSQLISILEKRIEGARALLLALEDGASLRLLEGIGNFELSRNLPHQIAESPTRFGRVGLNLEPAGGRSGWRLEFTRGSGPAPNSVTLPPTLGSRFRLAEVKGASFQQVGGKVAIAPEATSWQAVWKE